jgi:hypothetical protein
MEEISNNNNQLPEQGSPVLDQFSMLFHSSREQLDRKAALMKRLTVSNTQLEMASADGGKEESDCGEEDFGMRGGRRAAEHRYNLIKPPSLSPPPFTNFP